ncbi:MAG: PA2169 family four-helix-bundle protein [Chitinophagaceae bacterium]|nr:PA2169 family four-helix-bundle protein [Chitinophagaceae bacterium]
MKTSEKTAEVLNDLVQINNDRIEGYERAAKETAVEDADLRSLFNDMTTESRRYVSELSRCVISNGEEPAEGTTARGKIYRAWMDVKAVFTGKDRKAILASCEFGEDAAQRAYNDALEADADYPVEVRQLIVEQKASLKKSHDRIRSLRDSQPA